MAKILIGLEAAGNPDQSIDAWIIGEACAARGHEVCYVVAEPIAFAELAGPDAQLQLYQSPRVPPLPQLVMKPPKVGGWSDQMAVHGYSDPLHLSNLASIWSRQLGLLRPDAIIALGAPVLWLVGPHYAPTIIAGDGYALPPISGETFARLSPGVPPIALPEFLVDNANRALAQIGASPIDTLAELVRRCTICRYGLGYFDPYLALRHDTSLGVLGRYIPTATPTSRRPRVALFLDTTYPAIETILVALSGLENTDVDVFIKGATPAMRGYVRSLPRVTIWDDFNAMRWQASTASAIVHHGIAVIAADALLLGRPQMIMPWTSDQFAVLAGANSLGISWSKQPDAVIQEISGALLMLPNAADISAHAKHFARELAATGVADALPAIIDTAEAAIANHQHRTATIPLVHSAENIPLGIASASVPSSGDSVARRPASTAEGFCALPFKHVCVGSEGTARLCCMATSLIEKDGLPMSLYQNSVEEIWNSTYMRDIRQKMLNGEYVPECEVCYADEAATGLSYRMIVGKSPIADEPIDITDMQRTLPSTDYRVDELPGFIKLELGNLCNLRCRMCYTTISSEIERDPVHSKWFGSNNPLHAIWQQDAAVIGPHPRIGVARSGVLLPETRGATHFCWTEPRATFDIPVSRQDRLSKLEIGFLSGEAPGKSYVVRVNGAELARHVIDPNNSMATFDLSAMQIGQSAKIEIESEPTLQQGDKRKLGVPLTWVKIHRSPKSGSGEIIEPVRSRLKPPGPWYNNDDLIFKELIASASQLKRLYVTGGEPTLEPRFAEILQFLIDRGVASDIELELSTNCTTVDDDLLDMLQRFKSTWIMVSIDGIGATQEYIRYPARWPIIDRNIRRMQARGFRMYATPAVQAYNMLGIAEICEYARDTGINLSLSNIIRGPAWLTIPNMPVAAHKRAASKLRPIADAAPEGLKETLTAMIHHFESFDGPTDHDALRTFNLFTNDLDFSRGQKFSESLPELYDLIAESGYVWTDETRHFSPDAKRLPSRDRVFAWI